MGTLPAASIAQWKHDVFLSPFPLLDEQELTACRQGVARDAYLEEEARHAKLSA